MHSHSVRLVPVGDSAIVLEPVAGSTRINLQAIAASLRESLQGRGALDVTPGYDSILISYDPTTWEPADIACALDGLNVSMDARLPSRFVIPVLYSTTVGPDLELVAANSGLTIEELAQHHTAPEYTVRLLGFAPGFAYLDGLDPSLSTARRATPRTRVPAGSIAIAGTQTGMYATSSPGGWNVIGKTPLSLFDPHGTPPVRYAPGDSVRFVSIDEDEYRRLSKAPSPPEPTE